MTLEQLAEGLATLNAPNQGLDYFAGGYRRGGPKYNSQTGERVHPPYESARLTVFGERAKFLYDLIESGKSLAEALESSRKDGSSQEAHEDG